MALTRCSKLFSLSCRNVRYYMPKAFHSRSRISSNLEFPSKVANLLGLKFSTASNRLLHTTSPALKKVRVSVTFVKSDGSEVTGKGKEGESLLDVIVNNDLNLEGYGACEGTLSCSTCHVIFKPEDFEKLSEKATDEELDMLDMSPEVCSTSRLGCQVYLTKDMEGLTVKVPAVVRDARELPGGKD